jgi:putative endonuclease
MKSSQGQLGHTGSLGEELAVRYLRERGHRVLARNYRQKWGEIDIVSSKGEEIHFVEVKSVSCEIKGGTEEEISRITRLYIPEERVHEHKSKRLIRTIETYIAEKRVEGDWSFDVAAVFLDPASKRAFVRLLKQAL